MSSKRDQSVLEEDAYVSQVGAIIERDYFPQLAQYRAQLAYLAAGSNEADRHLVVQHYQATPLHPAGKPDLSLAGASNASASTDSSTVLPKSLTSFLYSHTSEDNAAFDVIQEQEQARRNHENRFFLDQERKSLEWHRQHLPTILTNPADRPTLALTADARDAANSPTAESTTNTALATVASMSTLAIPAVSTPPTGMVLVKTLCEDAKAAAAPSRHEDRNTKAPNPGIYRAKNNVMFFPDSIPSGLNPSYVALRPQIINAANTRLEVDPHAGTNHGDGSSIAGDSEDGASSTRGYDYVATPNLAPGVDMTPVMTWGQIEGTPFCLDPSATPIRSGPEFRLPATPAREQLAHQLNDQAMAKKRKLAGNSGRTPNHNGKAAMTPLQRLAAMSPAAKQLVNHSGTLRSDKQLRASYATPTRAAAAGGSQTPRRTEKPGSRTPMTPSTSLTDDLLRPLL